MPIYEYRCGKCGDFDVMQKITEKPLRKCPTCKSRVTKLISNTAFQLKGTGWYVTDYANKGKPKASETAQSSEKGPAEKASTDTSSSDKKSGDTKSAGKAKGENAAA